MFYRLVCGVRKIKPGRYVPKSAAPLSLSPFEQLMFEINAAEQKALMSKEQADKARSLALEMYITKKIAQVTINA
jgi:hypothetical protein